MSRISTERASQIAIGVQLLVLIRTLAEYFRLKHFGPHPMTLAIAEPYITGALIAAVCTAVCVGLYFFRKFAPAIAVAILMIAILLAYKLAVLG
jgi:hypothetical protein